MALRRCFSLFLSRLRRSPPTAENLGKGSSGRGGQATSNVSKEVGPLVTWNSIHRKFDAIRIQAKIWSNLVLKKLSWQHIQAGHFPFRKDCRTCQEACAKEKASSLPWINSEVEAGTRTVKGLDLSKGPKLQPHIISCWRLEEYNRKNLEGRIGSGAVAPWWHPCPTIGPAYIQSPD